MNTTSQINPEQNVTPTTSFMDEEYEHELRCGICARAVDVSDETYLSVTEIVEAGLENPFRCELCAEEYDEVA